LKVHPRPGSFRLKPESFVVKAGGGAVEVDAISLNTGADTLKCTFQNTNNLDWITVPKDTLKGGGKFKITVKANTSSNGKTGEIELVDKEGQSFNPQVKLTIKQNQSYTPEYK
jgi:hypothetical protein